MKLKKVKVEKSSCKGCAFNSKSGACLLHLLENLENITVEANCMTEKSYYIYKLKK